jgi:type IV pilus assembly protein PilM
MRLLGLDIGSTSIKAVEVDTAFGRFEVHEYHEVNIPPGASSVDAAGSLINSLPKAPDRILTTLRSNRVTYRNLKLPTRDKKAIRASVGFELEDDLPFEEDEASFDYITLGTHGSESHVHVAATLKKTVGDYLTLLSVAGVEPDTLTTEASAYRALLRKMTPEAVDREKPVMLVNIGHDHTTIYIQFQGTPLLCRETPWGGQEINLALSKRYNLSIEAAEKTKMDNGFVLPLSQIDTVSEEQRDFSTTVYHSLHDLIRDIKQADLSCKNLTGERTGLIYLSGGTSLLPGILAVIAEDVKIPTQPLRALSSLGGSGVTYSEQTDAKFALAAATALSFINSEKPFLINFRKGIFSKTGRSHEIDLSLVKKPLKTLGIAAILLLVILGVESTLYTQKLKDTNTQLEKSVKSFFGGVSSSALRTYLANTSSLKRNIEGELNKERELVKLLSPNPYSPLDVLKEFSSLIPRDLVVDTMKYQVGSSTTSPFGTGDGEESKVELQFFVANTQLADRLSSLLGSKLKEMRKSEAKEVVGKDGTKRIQITFTGKLAGEASSGK